MSYGLTKREIDAHEVSKDEADIAHGKETRSDEAVAADNKPKQKRGRGGRSEELKANARTRRQQRGARGRSEERFFQVLINYINLSPTMPLQRVRVALFHTIATRGI